MGLLLHFVSLSLKHSLRNRNVTMLDSSLMVVEMTLWGDKAEEFSDDLLATFPIIGYTLENFFMSFAPYSRRFFFPDSSG